MIQKEKILECTFAHLSQSGLKSVSMDSIASALKVSKKTIYNFFPSKSELIVESVKYGFDILSFKVERTARCMPNPLVALVFVAVETIKFYHSLESRFINDVFSSKALEGYLSEIKSRSAQIREKMVSEAIDKGLIQKGQSVELIALIFRDKWPTILATKKKNFTATWAFEIVTTLLSGVCTSEGRNVLMELKENYS